MTILDAVVFVGILMNVDKERRPAAFVGMLLGWFLISGLFTLLR